MAGSWEVRRDVLLEAIRLLDLVPSQSGIPSSDFFLVQADSKGRVWMSTAAGAMANVKLEGTGEWPFLDLSIWIAGYFAHLYQPSVESRTKRLSSLLCRESNCG